MECNAVPACATEHQVAHPAGLDLVVAFLDRLQAAVCQSVTGASDAWAAARRAVMAADPEPALLDAVSEKWAGLARDVPAHALRLLVQLLPVGLELCKPAGGRSAERSFAAGARSASAPEPPAPPVWRPRVLLAEPELMEALRPALPERLLEASGLPVPAWKAARLLAAEPLAPMALPARYTRAEPSESVQQS